MVKTSRLKTIKKEKGSNKDQRQFKNLYPKLHLQHQMQIENGSDEEEFSGPLTKRSCQDVICCVIFLAFWVGMGYVSFIALRDGQPERLLYGADSFGNICGRKNDAIENINLSGLDMSEKPFLFSFNPVTVSVDGISSTKICLENCPNESLVTPGQYAGYEICLYSLPPEDYNALHLTGDLCPRPPVPSSFAILNRCVPTTLIDVATSFINTEWINTVLADIETSWREICYLCTIALDRSELDNENVQTLLIYSGVASGVTALIAVALVIGGCGMIFLFLITSGQPQAREDGTVEYIEDEMIKYMRYYYIFGILWGTQFVLAFEQCVTAGAVAEWFFARDKKSLGSPISKSMGRVLRYHVGSIAFGSFIIAVVMLARLILGYIQSKNAYIEIAIYGYSFCKAAQKAFTVIVSNALRVAAINSVGDFLLLLAKITVTAGVIAIGIEFFQENPDVNFYAVPIAVAAIFAFIVSHIFLSVYEMTIDTLLICFCEDCEMNDGLSQPYFMSRNLMNFVDNAKKAQRLHDARRKTKS
ncbi:Choline transporter-like protein 3 [Holothuria leucospilota]|uniref:Choline transporter-like protein n=1 Tax=Holothuria leucospilota TaxID=206669 RepID=A0A9Q1BVY5_HOLLE|nr:Choline transporter-like protein 3 [Holothuria leucospilota]